MRRIQRAAVTCSEYLLLPIAFVIFFLWNRHERKMLRDVARRHNV